VAADPAQFNLPKPAWPSPTSHACDPVHNAAVTPTWQLPTLPSVPEYGRLTPTDAVPCLGKPVPSSTNTPSRAGIAARNRRHTVSAFHDASEMKYWRAVAAGIAQPLPHRFHRLAAAVAQDPLHIAAQATPLRAPTEVVFERFQPGQQMRKPRGRGVIEHCAAAYQTRRTCTMSSRVITREFTPEFANPPK
jgi:hypothetical protein